MKNTKEIVAENLRSNMKRLRKGKFTQETLAEAVGVSHGFIRQIENKQSSASLDTLVQISNALDCEVSELLRSEPEAENVPQTIIELSQVIAEQENKIKALQLSESEMRIIDKYRNTSDLRKEMFHKLADMDLDSNPDAQIETLLKPLDKTKQKSS